MQYDDHAKGTPVTTPTHADRGPPDRLLSGIPQSGQGAVGTNCSVQIFTPAMHMLALLHSALPFA